MKTLVSKRVQNFEIGDPKDERWTTPSVPTGSNDFTQLASEMFSANLTIDFGSWTESGGTYTFSDNDPASSTV